MDEMFAAIQAGQDAEGFIELARTPKGRLFRKQILRMNESFIHPANKGKRVHVDEAFAKKLQENFKAGLVGPVQVPIVNDKNQHSEDPTRNIGEVVDVEYDDKGVYAIFDARKNADDIGSTLLGASALMHLNHEDTTTGAKHGPALYHMAITNRPYIANLGEYEEIVAASADTFEEQPVAYVPAGDEISEDDEMDLDTMLAALKNDHGIDVVALQEQASGNTPDQQELLSALSGVLASATGKVELSGANSELTVKDVADAVIELAEERVELSGKVEELMTAANAHQQEKAEAEVDGLIRKGRILPKQRETMVWLSRNDREKFDALVPDDAIVSLTETGVATHDAPEDGEKFQQDVDRLAAIANGKQQ